MDDRRETHEIMEGEILFIGTSYFLIDEIREPQHPAYPGLAFYGRTWSHRNGAWGKVMPHMALYVAKWRVVNDEIKRMIFPDLCK